MLSFKFRALVTNLAVVLCCTTALFVSAPKADAQRMAIKTNTLEYLALTPNATFEARLNPVLSLQVGVALNPFRGTIAGYSLANFRVEPELRYWLNRPMARNFIAFSTTVGSNTLTLNHDHHLRGDFYAAGFSFGHALVLSKHWNLELEAGIGVGWFKGYNYHGSIANLPDKRNYDKVLPVPIRCQVSICYVL